MSQKPLPPWDADTVARHVQMFGQMLRNHTPVMREHRQYMINAMEAGREHLSEQEIHDLNRLCNAIALLTSWGALQAVRQNALDAAERLQAAEAEARRVEQAYRESGWEEFQP
jgi:hypothetical protein